MAKNRDFLLCKEERKEKGFFKVIQGIDIYSENMGIPKSFGDDHMPKTNTTFKIHHTDTKKSWDVVYCVREKSAIFSRGWRRLAREYPLALGDTCKLTLIKPDEMVLVVTKP